ncbi:MAG: ORC1-type DNA replication protein [Nanoarchaeota archaeon]
MQEKRLIKFFENFIDKKNLFKNRNSLQTNFFPEQILHREEQINQIANIIAPLLKNQKPSNLFLYGKTGTGKTLTIKYITKQIQELSEQKKLPIKIIYMNCKLKKIAETEYRLVAQLAREFGKAIPTTGFPTEEIYNLFFEAVDKEQKQILLVLDEIDQLVQKTGNEILYNLTRMNSELKNSQVSIIGISNDLIFVDSLDPRVKSSLSEEEIVFPPYNAMQIQDILKQRAKEAFIEDSIEQGVIEKCAAYAARDHGDARRAIELLRVAGEIAERESSTNVNLKHLDIAEGKIENDRITEILLTQPKQYHAVLYSIFKTSEKRPESAIFTGEIYDFYQKICEQNQLRPLTQRRISDILAEFDLLGLIHAKIISKGRYGRTREINLNTSALNESMKQLVINQLTNSL